MRLVLEYITKMTSDMKRQKHSSCIPVRHLMKKIKKIKLERVTDHTKHLLKANVVSRIPQKLVY